MEVRVSDPILSHHIDILIEHVLGPMPVRIDDSPRRRAVKALLLRRLLATIPYASPRPTHTILSEAGRLLVAGRLARAAEVLVKAGHLDLPAHARPSARDIYLAIGASQTNPAKSPNLNTSQKPDNSDSSIGRCNPEIDSSLRITSSADAPASCFAASVNR